MIIQGLNFFLFLFISFSAVANVPQIRVRIGHNLRDVQVSGLDIEKKINGRKKKQIYHGKKSLRFNCLSFKKLKNLNLPLLLASLTSATGLIRWENTAYQGQLNVLAAAGHKGCDLVNTISLEAYLDSLLAKEMNASWPLEALKAQAVAARSYAYEKIVTQQVSKAKGFETYYDLENSEKHQVNGSFFDTTKRTNQATRETLGEILKHHSGKLTPIFFHAKCGGRTFVPSQVWSHNVDGYESVDCPFCHKYGQQDWELILPKKRFQLIVNETLKNFYNDQLKNPRNKSTLKIVPDSKNKSLIRVYDDERLVTLQKSRLRSVLGRQSAPSNYYHLEQQGQKVILRGKGMGHGVGLCQLGALELAKRGYNYKQILSHYFPQHKIEKIY